VRQARAFSFFGKFSPLNLFLAGALAITASVVPAANAVAAKSKANPKYAAIVIDANTGKTLFSANADQPRYPASLTKMMTLYLIFEGLSSGKITKDTRIPFSVRAASMPPTKLGVKPGGSITVETAIYSLVTKSANDVATAVAEFLGGSEEGFARIMTQKAHQLGMTGTLYRNASGLPNDAQHSTAHDLAVLGLALREHYPQYYGYFSTRSFSYGKYRMANHNKLLGRVRGVDGIKTGYTRMSGFNLVSSVSDGNRRLVAVVMGGSTGRARDDQMAALIKKYLPKASTRGGGPLIAKTGNSPFAALASAVMPKRDAPAPDVKPDSEVVVATDEAEVQAAETAQIEAQETVAEETAEPVVQAYAEPAPRPKARLAPTPKSDVDPISTASTAPEGWAIQVASAPSEDGAKAILAKTSKQAPKAVASASPFTVPFEKGGTTYYRARFGGFASKTAAWDACGALKKKKISCYAIEQ
jgi:D-alanyl-D-alanine carboxypeptidase